MRFLSTSSIALAAALFAAPAIAQDQPGGAPGTMQQEPGMSQGAPDGATGAPPAAPGAGAAPEGAAAAPPAGEQPRMAAPSEEQLDSFVTATLRITEIQQTTQSQMQGAEGGDKGAQLQQEAQIAMAAAVEQEGLSVEEYNAIAQQAQADPALSEDIQERLKTELGQ